MAAKDIRPAVQKITDVVSILGPALVAVVGVISKVGANWMDAGVEIATIALGAVSSIASVIYNVASKKEVSR